MTEAFNTITGAHWRAMFAAHRALGHYHGNAILAHIRARLSRQATPHGEFRQCPPAAPERRPDAFNSQQGASEASQSHTLRPHGSTPCPATNLDGLVIPREEVGQVSPVGRPCRTKERREALIGNGCSSTSEAAANACAAEAFPVGAHRSANRDSRHGWPSNFLTAAGSAARERSAAKRRAEAGGGDISFPCVGATGAAECALGGVQSYAPTRGISFA
jgi:hypothetical protein